MSVILYVIKFCSKFLFDFYGLGNIDLQNNYVIELIKCKVFNFKFWNLAGLKSKIFKSD